MGALSNTNAHLLFTISWYDFRLEPFLLHGQQRGTKMLCQLQSLSLCFSSIVSGCRCVCVCMCVISRVKYPFKSLPLCFWQSCLLHLIYASLRSLISCHKVCYLSCYVKLSFLPPREQPEIWWLGTFSSTTPANISVWWTRMWRACQLWPYWSWKVRKPLLSSAVAN